MTHVTFEQLVDYAEGRLDAAATSAVTSHLSDGCVTCQTELDWLRQTLDLMEQDRWESPPAEISQAVRDAFPIPPLPISGRPSRWWLWLGGIVLLLLLLAGAILSYLLISRDQDQPTLLTPTATMVEATRPRTTPTVQGHTTTPAPPTLTPIPATMTATSTTTPTVTATATTTPTPSPTLIPSATPTALTFTQTPLPPPPATVTPIGDDDDTDNDDDDDDDDTDDTDGDNDDKDD